MARLSILLIFLLFSFLGKTQTQRDLLKQWDRFEDRIEDLFEAGKLNEVLKETDKALEWAKGTFRETHQKFLYRRSVKLSRILYEALDTLNAVIPVLEDWVKVIDQELGPTSPEFVEAVHELATQYYELEKPQSARRQWERIKYKEHATRLEWNTMPKMVSLIKEYYRRGDREYSLILLKNLLEELKDLISPWSKVYLELVTRAAKFYHEIDDPSLADTVYQYLFARNSQPDSSVSYLDFLALINFYVDQKNPEAVKLLNKKSVEVARSTHPQLNDRFAGAVHAAATTYEKAGLDTLAEKTFIEYAEIQKEINDSIPLRGYINLALFYARKGRFDKSEPLYRAYLKSLEGSDLHAYTEDYELANITNKMARLYLDAGLYELALNLYSQELAIKNKEPGRLQPKIRSEILGNIGLCHFYLKRYEMADSLNQAALALDPDNLAVLNNQALIHWNRGEFQTAEGLFKEAENLILKKKQPSTYNLAIIKFNIGDLKKRMGEMRQSEELMLEAFGMQQDLPRFDRTYLNSLQGLGNYYTLTEQYPKANQYFRQLLEIRIQQIPLYFDVLSQQEKAQLYGNIRNEFEIFNSFALDFFPTNPGITSTMYDHQLATKAVLLNASQKLKNRILESHDTTLIDQFQQWEDLKQQMAQFLQQSDPDKKAIRSVEAKIYDLEKSLAASSSVFSKESRERHYRWQDVRDLLKKGEAAVEIIRLRRYDFSHMNQFTNSVLYAALIVTSKTKEHPDMVIIPNGNDLEGRYLKYYRNSIAYKLSDSISYAQFWEPVRRSLKKVKKVYFSPDGVYNLINLNTLFNEAKKSYLIDEIEIQQVTNTKDLLITSKVRSTPGKNLAILFGNPAFDEASEQEASLSHSKIPDYRVSIERSVMLAPLPGSQIEVEEISGYLVAENWDLQLFTGKKASEAQIKAINNPGLLHVATHGFFRESDLEGSPSEKALLQSGLMMAGAAKTISGSADALQQVQLSEDGILTAYEAMHLNLDDTELVVLSACETGLGQVQNGEGVYGLQRAFFVSGARSILMSLWKVNDQTTRELMTRFYNSWLQSGDKIQAFREAQKQLKEKFESPYYWGAFVLIGN